MMRIASIFRNLPAFSGWLYNAGNFYLLVDSFIAGRVFHFDPVTCLSALFFFVSGIAYTRDEIKWGHGLAVLGAVFLTWQLGRDGLVLSALLVAILHVGGKTVGTFDLLPKSHLYAAIGPMITRLPIAWQAYQDGNFLLTAAAVTWVVADACFLAPVQKPAESAISTTSQNA